MTERPEIEVIKPDWPAPANVHAFTTTRNGGFSQHLMLAMGIKVNQFRDLFTGAGKLDNVVELQGDVIKWRQDNTVASFDQADCYALQRREHTAAAGFSQ